MSAEHTAEKDAHVVVDHRVVNSRGRRWIEATCSCGAVVSNRRCRFFTTAFAVHVKRATRVASPETTQP